MNAISRGLVPSFRAAQGNQLQLRYYQEDAVGAVWHFLGHEQGNGLAVLPTGSGKALCLAEICKRAIEDCADARIFVITTAKELVRQNFKELIGIWPEAPAGIFSAGLRRKDTKQNIIFGSIQSMHKRAYDLQPCHLILVDEAQTISRSQDTTWNRFFSDVEKINGGLRIIGFTATDFRLDSGRLTEGKGRVFDRIIYEYSIIEAIEEGYLAPPVSRSGLAEISTAGVHTRAGEFVAGELEAVAIDPATVESIADEMVEAGRDRTGWILFGCGVKHCLMLRAALLRRGIDCEGVFSTEPKEYNEHGGRAYNRDQFVEDFKNRKIKCLVSVNALAVGFNAKHVDLIGMARPTQSVGLYIQIVGRGTRPLYAPGYDLNTKEGRIAAIANGPKPNCLLLDWGGNINRHGLIDQPNIKKPKGEGRGDIPLKVCQACGYENVIAARECKQCGAPFDIEGSKLSHRAAAGALLSTQMPPPQWLPVKSVRYGLHSKPGKTAKLKVSYQCGLMFYHEWICLDDPKGSYPRNKAEAWWAQRRITVALPPASVELALTRTDELRQPTAIQVRPSGNGGKYFDIVGAKFEP